MFDNFRYLIHLCIYLYYIDIKNMNSIIKNSTVNKKYMIMQNF